MQRCFARTPRAPYLAVFFSLQRKDNDPHGYRMASARMHALAREVAGYIGVESACDDIGFGMTLSDWETEEAIVAWKQQAEHAAIRERGRWYWYDRFQVRVARVERSYGST